MIAVLRGMGWGWEPGVVLNIEGLDDGGYF